jgi:hypothetical protein
MLKRALIAIALLSLVPPARAEDKAGEKPNTLVAPSGQYLDLAMMALPIVINRKVVNYAFIHARINFSQSVDASKLREKEPFFRDAMVRSASRTPLNQPNDTLQVDEARFKAALMAVATSVAGPGAIKSVTLTSQSPLRHVRPPKTQAPPG